MSKIRNEKKGIRLAAGLMAVMMMAAVPFTAAAAEPWDKENGQYVDASGAPIAGALEKGITVTKYQNRANADKGGIDWAKGRGRRREFRHDQNRILQGYGSLLFHEHAGRVGKRD